MTTPLLASLMARLAGVFETEAIQRVVSFYLTHDAVDGFGKARERRRSTFPRPSWNDRTM